MGLFFQHALRAASSDQLKAGASDAGDCKPALPSKAVARVANTKRLFPSASRSWIFCLQMVEWGGSRQFVQLDVALDPLKKEALS